MIKCQWQTFESREGNKKGEKETCSRHGIHFCMNAGLSAHTAFMVPEFLKESLVPLLKRSKH